MIKINRLRMKNFKSFKKANIPFSDGFTVIAGSNASGKSNILDAVLFVLGETSLRMLRASKLNELVNHDAAENYAKVEIELQRENETIEVARLIDKHGRGIVKLNGKRKSLDEVTAYLQEIGAKTSTHNVVVQGDVTRLIEMSHKERRQIIDEIAGLQEFEEKKEEALKKLDQVEQRVKEVGIVLKERVVYLEQLQKERDTAMKYTALQDELKSSKATILGEEIKRIKNELAGSAERKAGMENEFQRKDKEKIGTVEELKAAEVKLEELNSQMLKASEELYQKFGKDLERKRGELLLAESEINNKRNDIEKNKARVENALQKIEEYETRIEQIAELLKNDSKEFRKAKDELMPFEERFSASAAKLKIEAKKLKDAESELEKLREGLQKKTGILHELNVKTASAEKENDIAIEQLELIKKEEDKLGVGEKKKRLDAIEDRLEKAEKELEKAKAALAKNKEKELKKEIGKLKGHVDELLELKGSLSKEAKGILQFLNEFGQEAKKESYLKTKAENVKKLASFEKESKAFEKEIEKIISEKDRIEKTVLQLRKRKEMFEAGPLSKELQELQQRSNELELKVGGYKIEQVELKKRVEDLNAEKQQCEAELEQAEGMLKMAVDQKENVERAIKELEGKIEQASQQSRMMEEEKQRLLGKMQQLSVKREELEQRIDQLQKEMNEFAVENSRNEVRMQDLNEEFKNYETIKLLEIFKLGELRGRVSEIEGELMAIGAVNMKALENFDQYNTEVLDIKQKADKLDEERKAVMEMIDKVEVRKLQVFMDCFNEINTRFNNIYYQFFEGEGRLGLTNAENPLEGGMTIEAKYKEDKLKSIDAMSGGEKSLTALAFLFAIQSYRPSPFYLFDEADAALDKENSLKLGRMLKEISRNSQFIAISHNDSIVKQADQLIGVALNKQRSSVVGLRLKGKLEEMKKGRHIEIREEDLEKTKEDEEEERKEMQEAEGKIGTGVVEDKKEETEWEEKKEAVGEEDKVEEKETESTENKTEPTEENSENL